MFLIRISKTLLIHKNVYLAYFKISIGDQQKSRPFTYFSRFRTWE